MRRIVPLLLACTALLSALPQGGIEDQFRKVHRIPALFDGRPLVFIAGDQRKTDVYIKEWHSALKERFADTVLIIGLADLNKVPFFVPNSSVRNAMAADLPGITVLCDWDGAVFRSMGFRKDSLTVRVYTAQKRQVGDVNGPVNAALLDRAVTLISSALQ
jgi:hypothetical protein